MKTDFKFILVERLPSNACDGTGGQQYVSRSVSGSGLTSGGPPRTAFYPCGRVPSGPAQDAPSARDLADVPTRAGAIVGGRRATRELFVMDAYGSVLSLAWFPPQ